MLLIAINQNLDNSNQMEEAAVPLPQRDTILLSHANPEDNEFTLWLALQLANEGYRVWCDLTKLLGGEVFWDDIEDVIKSRAAKVLYILSRTSNAKDGPLRELQCAQGVARRQKLKDFIIPLLIDDLPFEEITIELGRINALSFAGSWAEGLARLLEKLTLDETPTDSKFNRTAVNDWWRTQFSAELGVRKEPEGYLSNWFPFTLPSHINYHYLSRKTIGELRIPDDLPFPAVKQDMYLITFAEANDFDGRLGPEVYIAEPGLRLEVSQLLGDRDPTFANQLIQLLKDAWERKLRERKLPAYDLASRARCFYFSKGQLPNDKVFFTGVDGERTYRAMVGYSTRTNPTTGLSLKRFWHFAIQARPLLRPTFAYVFKPHVLFTNDGVTIWEAKNDWHQQGGANANRGGTMNGVTEHSPRLAISAADQIS